MPSVRRVRWAKIRVVAVTIAALAILSVLSYLLTGGSVFQPTDTIFLYVPDATGLAEGSLVRVDGIDVGKVGSVALAGGRDANRVVKLSLRVKDNRLASITADSTAEISSDTVIGDKYVDITSHRSPEHIRPWGEIHYLASPDVMKSLDLAQFEQQLRIVEATVSDIEAGRSPVGEFVQGEQMYRDLLKRVTQLSNALRKAVDTTGEIGQIVYSDELYRQVAKPLIDVDRSLARVQGNPLLRETAMYDDFQRTAKDLRKTIADMRGGALFRSDALYQDLNRSLAKTIAQVDELNAGPGFRSSEAYDSLAGWARETEAAVRDFRENPKKYLRLKVF